MYSEEIYKFNNFMDMVMKGKLEEMNKALLEKDTETAFKVLNELFEGIDEAKKLLSKSYESYYALEDNANTSIYETWKLYMSMREKHKLSKDEERVFIALATKDPFEDIENQFGDGPPIQGMGI